MSMQKYEISNWHNEYSEQIYPLNVLSVRYVNFESKKYPNGCIQICCQTVDGYYCTGLLKCYTSKKGKYTIWGKHRIYVGYSGSLELIGVPLNVVDAVKSCAKQYETIVK